MILVSTYAKLVKADAMIYRVDFPAMSAVKLGLSDTADIPASHEHFATKPQAEHAKSRYAPFAVGVISTVRAASFSPWLDL